MHFKILHIEEFPGKGRGMVAGEQIKKGDLIERCPVLVLEKKFTEQIDKTPLYDYYFIWGKNDESIAIALGYGSIYNHSFEPNAEYVPNYEDAQLEFYALRDISEGEEILVNYNGTPKSEKPIWFEAE